MEKNLLVGEKLKLKAAEISSEPFKDWFFQERDHFRLDQLKYELLDSLIALTPRKLDPTTDLLATVAKNYNQFLTSIVTFAPQIIMLIQEFNAFVFQHNHHTSQSILLALILKKQTGKKVVLVVKEQKMKRNCEIFQCESECDTAYYVQRCLQKQKIEVIDIKEKSLEGLQHFIEEDHIVVIDLFGLDPPEYYLQLDRHIATLRKAQKMFVYHSSNQGDEVNLLLEKIQNRTSPFGNLHIELAPPHPVQSFAYEEQDQLFPAVIKFVQSITPYAEKQDILIFYPLDEPFHKYFRRIKEEVVKVGLKDSINFIVANNEKVSKDKSNVFLVHSNKQLLEWNYHYNKIFMVVDYGFEENFIYDYELGCYVETMSKLSFGEKCSRMMWVGSDRCGTYHFLDQNFTSTPSFEDRIRDISGYVMSAIAYKQEYLINFDHPRVKKCMEYLTRAEICRQIGNKAYQVRDLRFIEYSQHGLSPIEVKMMLNIIDDAHLIDKNKQKYLNLMAMTVAILKHPGNLRKMKKQIESNHIKPYAVWRKSGYLESCLEILTKCELIEQRKLPHNSQSQDFRRKTSKVIEGHELYSKAALKKKKKFEEMEVPDLITQYSVNEQLLNQLRDYTDDLRSLFDFEMIPILVDREIISKIMWHLSKCGPQTNICIYTGSKVTEYFNTKVNLHMSEVCLFNILNQRPEILKIVRIRQQQGEKKIVMANTISKETYVQIFSSVPSFQRPVLPRSQLENEGTTNEEIAPEVIKEFSFSNIPSSVFEELVKNNGETIESFEYDNNCHLYLFMEIGNIKISCFKDEIENKHYVWQNLNQILTKLTYSCRHYTKKLQYMGVVNFIMTDGAQILQMIDYDQISRCIVTKLPPEIARQYVEVVMEEYPYKNIQIIQADNINPLPSAVIEFYSKKGYLDFERYYNANLKQENFFEMKPLSDFQFKKLQNEGEDASKFGNSNSTLLFRWYTWKSHCKAQVKFKTSDSVLKTIQAFKVNPLLDSAPVKIEVDKKNPCVVNLDNLKPYTDEIYIGEALKEYGLIDSVQILKTPLKETLGDAEHIGHLLKKGANSNEIVKHKILSMEKKECGLRVAKVAIAEQYRIKRICQNLNRSVKQFGEGRLYVEPIHEKQILIPDGCLEIYIELFEELIESLKKEQPNVRTEIREDTQNQNIYLVVISSIEETLYFVMKRFKQKLNGVKIEFPHQARNVVLNEIGVANLLDMEQRYNCKFIVSSYSSKIKVLCKQESLKTIIQDVEKRFENHFFYKVFLTSKVYKHFLEDSELLQQLRREFELSLSQLEEDDWAILLEGSAVNVQKAVIWLHQKGRVKSNNIQFADNTNLCGICGQQFDDSYRLFCQHRFCKECIIDYLRYSLSDMSQFPLRCPQLQCRKFINCMDLEHLLEFGEWLKIRTLSANEFLKNNEHFDYCMTPGCQQINRIRQNDIGGVHAEFMKCDICKNSYCLSCNGVYHPARTCQEAKMSEDELMKTFITQQGVRKCPGKKCKALVYRYTGCFKVQCIRCGTCMCFKCPPDQMEAYPDPTSCYNHLNEKHGGYF